MFRRSWFLFLVCTSQFLLAFFECFSVFGVVDVFGPHYEGVFVVVGVVLGSDSDDFEAVFFVEGAGGLVVFSDF